MFAFRVDEGNAEGRARGVGAEQTTRWRSGVRSREDEAGVGEDGAGLWGRGGGGGREAEIVDPEVAQVKGAGGSYGVLEGLGEGGEGDVGSERRAGGGGWVTAVG